VVAESIKANGDDVNVVRR